MAERTCVRCGARFVGGTLLCPDCQADALDAIRREYPTDPEGTDPVALDALSDNMKAQYDPESEEDPEDAHP